LIQDRRRAPFFYQTQPAIDCIRATVSGGRRSTALAVYLVLTESANRNGGEKARDGFSEKRSAIAALVGCSLRTLDRAVSDLEEAGVLEVARRNEGGAHLPNRWIIIDPARATTRGGGDVSAPTGSDVSAPLIEQRRSSEEDLARASSVPKIVKVDGRNLPFDALADTCSVPLQNRARVSQMTQALRDIRDYFAEERPELAGEDFERELAGEVVRRGRLYRERMKGATLTPTALAKWWHDVAGTSEQKRERFDDIDEL
jgi:hypothetical protein